jgi:type I restriction enzyme S subunit
LRELSIGGVIKYIKLSNLTDAPIPLPPINEQNEVIAVLDKVTTLIAQRKQQIEQLDLLAKSRFIEMFSEGRYPFVRLEDICGFITKGTTPPTNGIYSAPTETRIPYIKVYNLSYTGKLRFFEEPQYINAETHCSLLARSKVYPNDVLMNIVGLPLGKFALVTDDFAEWNINQAIAIFRSTGKVLPIYLMHAMMQPSLLRPFLDKAVGIRQVNLSLKQCRELEIYLPPLPLQEKFADFVRQTDKSKNEIQQGLKQLELQYNALMQQYFG